MSIIPKLVTLGLAAALSSPIRQHQIDDSSLDSQRINQLWLVTYLNEAGLEVVAQAKLANSDKMLLIAADADLARLESMIPAARDLAKTNHIKLRLIKFTNRVDIEDIVP
jgi:hypothetical protein